MIKLTLKGLARYIASSPSAQRKILQNHKYPAADEPFAMRMYYREATDCLKTYIRDGQTGEWLRQRALELTAPRPDQSGPSASRLRHNAEAVLHFGKHFDGKDIEVLDCPRFRLEFSGVSIGVVPDLCLRDHSRIKLFKLQFGGKALPEQSVRVITQCLLAAANAQGHALPFSSAVYVDLPRSLSYTAPRSSKKTMQDIKAACETIALIWDSITPPAKSKRSAAA